MASTIWFTGLPGSGKTTLASLTAQTLWDNGYRSELLDGDEIRGIVGTTGFGREDRRRHLLSAAYTAKLLNRHGVSVAAAFVSPHAEVRAEARKLIGRSFVEVFVDCPIFICMQRDPKGLYEKSRKGQIKGLTGVDDPYEPPRSPEIIVHTATEAVEVSARKIAVHLKELGFL